jgi:ATP-binding cassette subfamily C (CFTR/MRP) protein 1
VSLIYSRSLHQSAGVYDESAALTLMNNDVDSLARSLEALCDLWARVIEIAVGIWLLEKQLGWVCVSPLVIVFACVYISGLQAKFVGPKRKVWTQATQKRVGVTSSMLEQMKSVKMMGLSDTMFDAVHKLRLDEIEVSKSYRVTTIWRFLLCKSIHSRL